MRFISHLTLSHVKLPPPISSSLMWSP